MINSQEIIAAERFRLHHAAMEISSQATEIRRNIELLMKQNRFANSNPRNNFQNYDRNTNLMKNGKLNSNFNFSSRNHDDGEDAQKQWDDKENEGFQQGEDDYQWKSSSSSTAKNSTHHISAFLDSLNQLKNISNSMQEVATKLSPMDDDTNVDWQLNKFSLENINLRLDNNSMSMVPQRDIRYNITGEDSISSRINNTTSLRNSWPNANNGMIVTNSSDYLTANSARIEFDRIRNNNHDDQIMRAMFEDKAIGNSTVSSELRLSIDNASDSVNAMKHLAAKIGIYS